MSPEQIREKPVLEEALASALFLLFKHSPACPVSSRAFAAYGEFCEEHPDVPTGWIDVISQRPWSRWIAERTGVTHESPQALLIRNGRVVWHASHREITTDALADAVFV